MEKFGISVGQSGFKIFFFFFLNSGIISMATYIAPILTILRNL